MFSLRVGLLSGDVLEPCCSETRDVESDLWAKRSNFGEREQAEVLALKRNRVTGDLEIRRLCVDCATTEDGMARRKNMIRTIGAGGF